MAILSSTEVTVADILDSFKEAIYHLYESNSDQIVKLIDIYGETLKKNGNVRYCGTSDYGVLALIDSSECPPTFGADFNDIRGFILDGWQDMDNRKGELEMKCEQLDITLEDCFNKTQSDNNTHLVLCFDDESVKLIPRIKRRQADLKGNFHYLTLDSSTGMPFKMIKNERKSGCDSFDSMLENCQRNLQCKLVRSFLILSKVNCLSLKLLNTCSTGGHIVKGKIARNRMIDVKLTNSKLLERGTLIVQDFTNVEYDSAKMAILRSIHESDQVDLDITSKVHTTNISATSHQPYYPLYLRVRRNF